MRRIGVGVVGCGFVGLGAHVPAVAAIEDARLAAVADGDAKRRGKAVQKYRPDRAYEDYTELVKDPAVDAVVVAVPTPLHAAVVLATIAAGKHVLCEMPLAPTLEEVDTMAAAARRAGVCLMPGLNFRFTPNYVMARELMGPEELGEVTAVMYREFIPARDLAKQWPAGAWVWKVEESGGPLFTLAVWSIDLLRWLVGSEVTRVEAAAKYTVLEECGGTLGYDACAALRFGNGVVGSLQYSGTVAGPASTSCLEVVGSSTQLLQATGNDTLRLIGEKPARTEWHLKEPGPRAWGHQQQDEYFVRCLLEGRTPEITAEDGRKAMEIALRIARSG
jgi:predicted dehydrogenase